MTRKFSGFVASSRSFGKGCQVSLVILVPPSIVITRNALLYGFVHVIIEHALVIAVRKKHH